MLSFTRIAVVFAAVLVAAKAESHTVHFVNNCGFGTPTLVQNGNILSTGGDFTSNGPLVSATAYLQTGSCGINGEGCTVVETSLENPSPSVFGSCTDISVTSPHNFTETVSFKYFNGCDGDGESCQSSTCPAAVPPPIEPIEPPRVCCTADNVDLQITFCD